MFIGATTSNGNLKVKESDNKWSIDLYTNGSLIKIKFQIDSVAQVNILLLNEYYQLQNHSKLHSTSIRLSAYNGSHISLKDSCIVCINKQNQSTIPVLFLVADTNSTTIIGLNTSTKLNLIKHVMQINSPLPNYLKKFQDCFSDIGCLPGKHHIVIDTNHPPDVNPPRQISNPLHEKLKAKLDKKVEMKIIQAINEPTDWVNNLILVEKPNGSLRICLDPKELNKAIKRPTMPIQLQGYSLE